ncbi:MAG: bifunctional metallophosphatase/5'-nucleotidase [Spirochaetia bacterium]|nr:bifunctional metallophosphatase/5'-nucleotidase [Spirochaetia bacterium]
MKKKLLRHIPLVIVILIIFVSGCQSSRVIKDIEEPSGRFIPSAEISSIPLVEVDQNLNQIEEQVKNENEIVVNLICTSDVHGNLFPYDFIQDKSLDYSLMSVSTYVNEMREGGEHVVLLDNGDVLQGQPLVYYYNFITPDVPHIVARVNNTLSYDVSSVGNHDIEAGPEVYLKVMNESSYPYVGANIIDEVTKEPLIAPYVIINRGGVKIAVLGLTTPGIPNWLPKNLYEGIIFDDMVTTAQKWIPIIKNNEKPDMIVGLFHSGVSDNDSDFENASRYVGEKVDGFDAIFSGHDHKDTLLSVKSPSGKDVYIVGALNGARSVAHITTTFTYDEISDSFSISSISPQTVMMNTVESDAKLIKVFQESIDEVTRWVSTEVGKISETISSRDSMFADSPFVDLIHTLQLDITGADISISAPLSFDASLEEGSVYVRDMFSLYPYENLLYTMTLTGKEIHDMAEYSYGNWFNQMSSLDDDLIRFKRDENGEYIYSKRYNSFEGVTPYYNYDSFSGMNYIVDITKPAGDKVTIKTLANGVRFSLDASYTVAINSYRAQGGGGHLEAAGLTKEMAQERVIQATDKDLRYYLLKEFEKKEVVTPNVDNNWLVIPALWVKRGIKNSYPKMYGE